VLTVLPNNNQDIVYQFYEELETWLFKNFPTPTYRISPEWSKGWAYTSKGAWTNGDRIKQFQSNYDWKDEVDALAKYDNANLFYNPFLSSLFSK